MNKTYFYIGVGALALAAVTLGLTFVPALGVYMLISTVLLDLSALSFLSAQKKRENFNAVKYFTIAAYVLLIICILLFAGGIVYSAMQTKQV